LAAFAQINAGEEPYVSQRNAEDYDGPEYLEEYTESKTVWRFSVTAV